MDNVKVYGMKEIRERYGVGQGEAYRIIREVKSLLLYGGKLGKGKVLPSELEYWEKTIDVKAKATSSKEEPERPKTVCI